MKTIHTLISGPTPGYCFAQPLEQIAFFDIETTGLSPKASSLYLIGAMCYDGQQRRWSLTQWFADDYRSEAAIVQAFLEFLSPFQALYHFNGSTFDVPFVLSKCEKHNVTPSRHCMDLFKNTAPHQTSSGDRPISVDLLREIRPLKKKLRLPGANQTALEKWLGIDREDHCDGRELIGVYTEYMQKKILHAQEYSDLERLLLLHNREDMAGMLVISGMLSYLDCLHPTAPPVIHKISRQSDSLSVTFEASSPIPRDILLNSRLPFSSEQPTAAEDDRTQAPPEKEELFASLSLEKTAGILTIPLYRGTLKYFFTPYRDYYYLPREDYAIHKSVAQFVDPAFRRKATAATCYIKKEGEFLPSLSPKPIPWDIPSFYRDWRTRPAYYLLEDILTGEGTPAGAGLTANYLLFQLPHF